MSSGDHTNKGIKMEVTKVMREDKTKHSGVGRRTVRNGIEKIGSFKNFDN